MTTDDQPRDHVAPDDPEKSAPPNDLETNVKSKSTWLRLFFTLIIAACYVVTRLIFVPVVVLQFFWVLLTGETNKNLLSVSQTLASYTYQMMIFLSFNSNDKPFPFDAPLPTAAPADR